MSDVIPEKEWFLGHNIIVTDAQNGGTYNFTVTEETLNEIIDSEEANLPSQYLPEGSFWLMSELIIVFREKTVMLAPSGDSYLTFEPGVWFSYIVFEESANAVQPMYCAELSFSSPAFIKYIDEDVIPNTIARKNNISWDDLKHKPFDYIKEGTQFHYEWNGVWDEVTNKDAWAYKIDSIVPQPYDLFGSTITRWNYGKIQEYTVEASNVYDIGDNNFSVVLNSSDALLCLNNPLGSIAPGLYLMVNRADTDEGVIYDYFKSLSYTCSYSYAQTLSDMYIPSSVPVISKWAEVGQTVIVTAVDQQGRPMAWDVVDFPTIDASEYYTKTEIDALLNDYITTIDTLIGEEE